MQTREFSGSLDGSKKLFSIFYNSSYNYMLRSKGSHKLYHVSYGILLEHFGPFKSRLYTHI